MNSESVNLFVSALQREDDASALSLLDSGRATIHSVYFLEVDGARLSRPLIFLAVWFVLEKLVRALVALGAKIDSVRDAGKGITVTPAGDAIAGNNARAVALCLKLGAELACVYRKADSPPEIRTGLEVAIREAKLVSLIYLLNEVYTARPVRLSPDEVMAVVIMAMEGTPAKLCYGVLKSRGFNFKGLEEMEFSSEGFPRGTSLADALLSCAQKSGATDLLRYVVKDLGLVSSAERMESLKNGVDTDFATVYGHRPRADLTKYKCSACEVVGATSFCSFCKELRYCSKECQRWHWKTGGHKQECKTIQRGMRSKERGKEGSSGAAVSRRS